MPTRIGTAALLLALHTALPHVTRGLGTNPPATTRTPCHRRFLGPRRGSCTVRLAATPGSTRSDTASSGDDDDDGDDNDEFSLQAFQRAKEAATDSSPRKEEFDGYAMRDAILNKWGACYDVDFQRVESFGFRKVNLNVLPFRLGGRGPFRHETELDYLCHLQAVVEILQQYNQLDYVLAQIVETNKKPRAGTSPLVAVPLRLDLTPEQVDKILGY